ncbi:DUF6011 domain-containing protein [Streptomyces sp. NPDC096538]|uniref:DUF6011 domain-containing protein n=1 Tax=Streptomyces sp. NPDC096538 TaxID=3155427 RepID=UPI003320B4FF
MTAPPEGPVPCALCGRLLREAESKRLRLGRVCRERLAGRPAARRRTGTMTAAPHPRAVPTRPPAQLALELWADGPEPDDEPFPHITDVPTGALL